MSDLVDRLLPPVAVVDDKGIPKPRAMTREERLALVALAALQVAGAALAGYGLDLLNPGVSPASFVGFNAALAVGMVTAARLGNRIVGMLAALLAGFVGLATQADLGPYVVIPHYGLAMWSIIRMNRVTRLQVQARRAAAGPSPAGGATRSQAGGRGRARAAKAEPKGPPPSKRYTPPKSTAKRTSTLAKPKARPEPDE